MDKAKWNKIQRLFDEATLMEAKERQAFLQRECQGDPELMNEVSDMLAGAPPTGFLNSPNHPSAGESYLGSGLEGEMMGEFRLLQEIGHGGMGVVYLAEQPGLERQVAVKILPRIRQGDGQSVERFQREAKAASKLNHPNIVPILSVGESKGLSWYAMNYVEGPDLAELLRALQSGSKPNPAFGKFGTPKYFKHVVTEFAKICDAVHYAHQNGIIHRDIKPQNILVHADGRFCLTDFGLARDERFGSLSVTGQVHGTPHYMSPEQARASRNKVDHRTDVYSLCVVLYEMLSLRRPFAGESALEIIEQITSQHPKTLSQLGLKIPADLAVIAEKGMSKNAEERYASAGDLAADLRRYLRGEAILAKPSSRLSCLIRNVREHRAFYQSLGTGGLAAFIAIILWMKWQEFSDLVHVKVISEITGIEVDLYELNLKTGKLGSMKRVSQDFRVPVGNYRIVVHSSDSSAQFTRFLNTPGEGIRIIPRLRPEQEIVKGMIEVVQHLSSKVGKKKFLNFPWYLQVPFSPGHIWVDRYEVSNGEYWEYLRDTSEGQIPEHWADEACPVPLGDLMNSEFIQDEWAHWASLPVIGIEWKDARNYAEWAGKSLPTWQEWESLARGPNDLKFPWGMMRGSEFDQIVLNNKNEDEAKPWDGYWEYVWPVRENPAVDITFDYQLHAMFGNVTEWTESPYIAPSISDGSSMPNYQKFLVMGEDWKTETFQDCSLNDFAPVEAYVKWVGFRCVKRNYP